MKLKSTLSSVLFFLVTIPSGLLAQDVGTAADSQELRQFSLQLSYEHLKRDFKFDEMKLDVNREIYKVQVGFRPSRTLRLYGFAGSSNFPYASTPSNRQLFLGGGLKSLFIGEVYIEDEETEESINIQAGIGMDLQIARLQTSGNDVYDSFGLTRYQGAIDFGVTIFSFSGYFGFKLSKMTGSFVLTGQKETQVKAKGLFSMFTGVNVRLNSHLSLVSEFSFFTEKYWALGLKLR